MPGRGCMLLWSSSGRAAIQSPKGQTRSQSCSLLTASARAPQAPSTRRRAYLVQHVCRRVEHILLRQVSHPRVTDQGAGRSAARSSCKRAGEGQGARGGVHSQAGVYHQRMRTDLKAGHSAAGCMTRSAGARGGGQVGVTHRELFPPREAWWGVRPPPMLRRSQQPIWDSSAEAAQTPQGGLNRSSQRPHAGSSPRATRHWRARSCATASASAMRRSSMSSRACGRPAQVLRSGRREGTGLMSSSTPCWVGWLGGLAGGRGGSHCAGTGTRG